MNDIVIYFAISLSILIAFYRYIPGLLFKLAKSLKASKFDYGKTIEKDYSWQPMVSFILPCFNEGEHIYKTILSILEQDWPKNKLEIIVIDDKSTDDSYNWALKAKSLGPVIVLQNEENKGKREIFLHALQLSIGEICVSVDSDVILAPNALKELIACFPKNPKIVGVGGKVDIMNPNKNWISQIQAIRLFFANEFYKSIENVFRTVFCLSGCLTAYRKKALLQIEHLLKKRTIMGLDIKYGEDRYMSHQLLLHGGQNIVNLDARCWTKSPTTLSGLFSQQLRWRRSVIVDWVLMIRTLKQHLANINFAILLYYWFLMLYIIGYPLLILYALNSGLLLQMILFHEIILVVLILVYQVTMVLRKEPLLQNPLVFLAIGVILPISYFLITPLALFTLDSSSWETRKS